MLAGKVKLNHFLLAVGGVAAAGGAAIMLTSSGGESKSDEPSTTPTTQVASDPTPVKPVLDPIPVTPETSNGLRRVDEAVMSRMGEDLGGPKQKDVFKGQAWKINLYQDEGHTAMNRAKIDLDRDDKWDEKWSFDGENISRKVSPNDNEDYSQVFEWSGTAWVDPSAAAEATAPEPRPHEAAAVAGLRDVDQALMKWRGTGLGSKKIKDAVKGKAWKINLYQDDGQATMNRAKLDLDRDDKWDEKWSFDGENISRKVSPNDDEDYSQEFDWNGSGWTAR